MADTLIVQALRLEQQHVPCHLHALNHLRVARRHGVLRIRVEKPGHTCEFGVAALVDQITREPARIPWCLVNVSERGHQAYGGTLTPWRRLWPAAALSPASAAAASSGDTPPHLSGVC